MHKCLNILSQTASIVLYPMFMPMYGMLLYALSTQGQVGIYSKAYMGMYLSGTAILTLFIPLLLLLILWRKGYIDSLHINDAKQRTAPYIYTLICYGFWAYFLRVTMKNAYVFAVSSNRCDSSSDGCNHHQPLVEDFGSFDGIWRTNRRHM